MYVCVFERQFRFGLVWFGFVRAVNVAMLIIGRAIIGK